MRVTKAQAEEIRPQSELGSWDNYMRAEVIECGCNAKQPHNGAVGRIVCRWDRKGKGYYYPIVWDYNLKDSGKVVAAGDDGACREVKRFRLIETKPENYPTAKLGDVIIPRFIQDGEPGWRSQAVVADVEYLKERNQFEVRCYQIGKDANGELLPMNWFYAYEWEVVDERTFLKEREEAAEAVKKAEAAALKDKERTATARKHQKKAEETAAEALRLQAIAEAERDAMVALVARLREEPEHLIQFHADRVEKVTLVQDEQGGAIEYEAAALRLTPWEAK